MDMRDCTALVVGEVRNVVDGVDSAALEELARAISRARRVFFAGAGRSLLMLRAFAMRLMHLGFTVYIVSDVTTPAIAPDDLLVIGSASGETGTMKVVADRAASIGCHLAVLTIHAQSILGRRGNLLVTVPAATDKVASGFASRQPGGSSFEQSILLILDSVALFLSEQAGIDASAKLGLHANLE